MPNTDSIKLNTVGWDNIDWLKVERYVYKQQKVKSLTFIRYADDFLLIHHDLNVVQRCRELISEWLNDMGLELKPSKTALRQQSDKKQRAFV